MLDHIENVEMMWNLLLSYHASLMPVILRECYYAIGLNAEVDISMGDPLAKETLQSRSAVDRDIEEATECDMCCVRRRIKFLQICTDEVAVALELRAVNFREALSQAVNEATVLLWRMWCANGASAAQVNNAIDLEAFAATQRHGVDLRHMWISALCS